jgi:hypothetical protein
MMNKEERKKVREEKMKDFNPNESGLRHNGIFGLPFGEPESEPVAQRPRAAQAAETVAQAPLPKSAPEKVAFKPSSWVKIQEGVGFSVTSTDGYIISFKDNKFRLFNPSKVMIGVYKDEEEAKKKVENLRRRTP